ncbi:MAG: sulfite exporter TauE/SafE family protein [Gemmatimonadales bacterium]|nr:sulfite exporter TauE/SafE family protein [Gemmatimonadales bacterium]
MTTELEPRPLPNRALEAILEPATALVFAWIAAVFLVVHSDPLLATLVVLGAAGAFLAGLVGVGGAIIMVPLLVYVPPLLGVGRLTMHDITGVTMVQVLAAAASGVAGHYREGMVDRRVVAFLGSGMMLGSLVGGIGSRFVSSPALQGVFALMAAVGALMMIFYSGREPGQPSEWLRRWRKSIGVVTSLAIGLVAGAVGAGGAILLIPIMLHVFKLQARYVVGTSLAIVLLGAVMGVAGKLATNQIQGWPALALVAGALPAAQLGAIVSLRLRAAHLERLLALLIVGVAVKMWWDILR